MFCIDVCLKMEDSEVMFFSCVGLSYTVGKTVVTDSIARKPVIQ